MGPIRTKGQIRTCGSRRGLHLGTSRPILPPLPWPASSQLTDEDLKALYVYLRTVPLIPNHVPEYVRAATRRARDLMPR